MENFMRPESNRPEDSIQEQILSKFLFKGYQNTCLSGKLEKIDEKEKQLLGIDLEYHGEKGIKNIDEKAQLTYINQTLPTFAFELSSMQGDGAKYLSGGWLFANSDRNKTDYYFLVTEIFLTKTAIRSHLTNISMDESDMEYYVNNYQNKDLRRQEWFDIKDNPNLKSKFKYEFKLKSADDIDSCLVTKVKKGELINYLEGCTITKNTGLLSKNFNGKNLNKDTCEDLAKEFREYVNKPNNNRVGKIKLCEGISLTYSGTLAEKPINLVIDLEQLLKNLESSCQRKFYVDKDIVQTEYTVKPKKLRQ